jgi:IS30 family transposase
MNPQSGHTKHTEETKLEQASDTLSQLPRKPRSRRAQVEYLQASILDALDKGYSYSEVSALLAEQEIDIPTRTLKQYVRDQRRHDSALEEEEDLPIESVKPKATRQKGFVEIPKEL